MKKLKRRDCSVLPLVLKGKWYRMIEHGTKTEEYRDATDYWWTRLRNWAWKYPGWGKGGHKPLVVAFSLGYTKPTMFFRARPVPYDPVGPINHGSRQYGNMTEWGEPNTPHFVIALDERIALED